MPVQRINHSAKKDRLIPKQKVLVTDHSIAEPMQINLGATRKGQLKDFHNPEAFKRKNLEARDSLKEAMPVPRRGVIPLANLIKKSIK